MLLAHSLWLKHGKFCLGSGMGTHSALYGKLSNYENRAERGWLVAGAGEEGRYHQHEATACDFSSRFFVVKKWCAHCASKSKYTVLWLPGFRFLLPVIYNKHHEQR